jgi:hypothetical protein
MFQSVKKKIVVGLMDAMLAVGIFEQHSAASNRPTVSVGETGKMVAAGKRPIPDSVLTHFNLIFSAFSKLAGPRPHSQDELTPPALDRTHPEPPSTIVADVVEPVEIVPEDWRWTVGLVQKDYSLTEIAAIRRKSIDEIIEDLTLAAQAGIRFPTASLVDSTIQQAIQQVRSDPPSAIKQPVFRERPALWRLVQAMSG